MNHLARGLWERANKALLVACPLPTSCERFSKPIPRR